MTSFFDIIKHLNEKTPLEFESKDYNSFMINRGLSMMKDTVFYANECNKMYHLDTQLQHDFYFHIIPKGKRFGKWEKMEKDDDLAIISEYFGINTQVAQQYKRILTAEQLVIIKTKFEKGGRHGRASRNKD